VGTALFIMLLMWNAKNIEEFYKIIVHNKFSLLEFHRMQVIRDQISTASAATQRLFYKLLLRAELLKCPLQKWCTSWGRESQQPRRDYIKHTSSIKIYKKLSQRGYNGVLQWHCSYCGT
jgi:hypothetical protein